jgi:hypothetical protein
MQICAHCIIQSRLKTDENLTGHSLFDPFICSKHSLNMKTAFALFLSLVIAVYPFAHPIPCRLLFHRIYTSLRFFLHHSFALAFLISHLRIVRSSVIRGGACPYASWAAGEAADGFQDKWASTEVRSCTIGAEIVALRAHGLSLARSSGWNISLMREDSADTFKSQFSTATDARRSHGRTRHACRYRSDNM